MKKTVLKYGSYGALTICTLFLLALYLGSGLSFTAQEVIGYASMIVSLSFVYFGIRYYRNVENSGTISFGKALLIGLLISLITALAFGVLDLIYVKYLNPGFMEEYYTTILSENEAAMSAEEFATFKAKMESEKELFTSPVMNFLLMSSTVLFIGLIFSLISGLILQRKPNQA